jgi:hypothetical protein
VGEKKPETQGDNESLLRSVTSVSSMFKGFSSEAGDRRRSPEQNEGSHD